MKLRLLFLIIPVSIISCNNHQGVERLPLEGTWKLITGTLTENGKVTKTDYTQNESFIKIINGTHFAFLQHNLAGNKDTVTRFSAGGGTYNLRDSSYSENLEYCSAKEWEGKDFTFVISINNDTLVQKGVEVVKEKGINRYNVEEYVRWKK